MAKASREFQIFAKPAGSACNLACRYCYYLKTRELYPLKKPAVMAEDLLERYIVQHMTAFPGPVVPFSWHGGEPTLLGVDYFQTIRRLQRNHLPHDRQVTNGIQTNGTLLDDAWCRFLAKERFTVGISMDGPGEYHDRYRVSGSREPTHREVMQGYERLLAHRVPVEVLCVVNAVNVRHPLALYRFFLQIGVSHISFLPLVTPHPDRPETASPDSVPADLFGVFLSDIFDAWVQDGIGRIKVQIFEEAARSAFGQAHSLCVFRRSCGDIPVVEHNGDFYPCDHFVDARHRLGNIRNTPLATLIDSSGQRAFGEAKWRTLPGQCRDCDVLAMCNGGCPKDRFLRTRDGEPGLNYLCSGYSRFFHHCRPFVDDLAALWRARSQGPPPVPGRNDPCPCGSGRKYKKCCLGR